MGPPESPRSAEGEGGELGARPFGFLRDLFDFFFPLDFDFGEFDFPFDFALLEAFQGSASSAKLGRLP